MEQKKVKDVNSRLNKVLDLIVYRRVEVDGLINYLSEYGFFTAPASSKFHLNYGGGFLDHSLNVVETLLELTSLPRFDLYPKESCVIVGLFHDVYKVTDGFKRKHYEPKFNKDGKLSKIPYKKNKGSLSKGEAYQSALIISQFVPLYEDEIQAIMVHDGLFTNEAQSIGLDWCPLAWMLHYSDFFSGIFTECPTSRLYNRENRNNKFFCRS